MSIFLVRHGETAENAARVIQTSTAPLSMNGRNQAERLAERLAGRGVARILSSDLVRAAETARCIGKRIGVKSEFEPVLRERDFGDLRGTPYSTLKTDPFAIAYVPPNGESWEAFSARVADAWQRLSRAAAETRGNLLIVTHGLFCRALTEAYLTLPPGKALPTLWANAGLTEIDGTPRWTVRRLNCEAHLAD